MSFILIVTGENEVRINLNNISHYQAGHHGKAIITMMNGTEIKTVETTNKIDQKISDQTSG